MKDLTGQRFSRLLVIDEADRVLGKCGLHRAWNCICDCGTKCVVKQNYLLRGGTTSCGCYHLEVIRSNGDKIARHGHSKRKFRPATPTYYSWSSMMSRCNKSSDPAFEIYGGRGITVCVRWLNFDNFLEDIGERPVERTLDRIDVNAGYSKENCRWATIKEQARNTRKNVTVIWDGKKVCLSELSEITKISYSAIKQECMRHGPERLLKRIREGSFKPRKNTKPVL